MGFKKDMQQLWLLLWKNFRLQLRSPIGLFFEILAPALFAIILLPIRTIVKSENIAETTLYNSFDVDSLLPILQRRQIVFQPTDSALVNRIMASVAPSLNLTSRGIYISSHSFHI